MFHCNKRFTLYFKLRSGHGSMLVGRAKNVSTLFLQLTSGCGEGYEVSPEKYFIQLKSLLSIPGSVLGHEIAVKVVMILILDIRSRCSY